jgi:hypothetical protein
MRRHETLVRSRNDGQRYPLEHSQLAAKITDLGGRCEALRGYL